MKKYFLSMIILGSFLILVSCGGGGKAYEEEAASEESTPATEEVEAAPTTVKIVSRYAEIEDYDKWLAVYNEVVPAEARISHYVNADNPNEIQVFETTDNFDAAREAMVSDEIGDILSRAGVTSDVTSVYMNVMDLDLSETDAPYRVLIMHDVQDFDAWKKVFDGDNLASEAGMSLRGVGRDADNPNTVSVVFATNDLEAARAMIGSDELKEAMQSAGVSSEPEIRFLVEHGMQ